MDAFSGEEAPAVRPTLQVLALLNVLASDMSGEWYGFALMRAAGLKSGTAYPILARLEKAKWVSSTWEDTDPSADGRPRRRIYRLTPSGYAHAAEMLRAHRELLTARADPATTPRRKEAPA